MELPRELAHGTHKNSKAATMPTLSSLRPNDPSRSGNSNRSSTRAIVS
jgi:hypothetical protein